MLVERAPSSGESLEGAPELSVAIPCYNEQECLPVTMPALASALGQAGVDYELVLVDNGSTDRTREIIDELAAQGLPIVKGMVRRNIGFGHGLRTGLSLARGRIVGTLCADGQVGPESVLEVYAAIRDAREPTLAKVRRRFRKDGLVRKVVSVTYNGVMHLLFPGLRALDLNGHPKLLHRETLEQMELASDDWFLDAEIMLKARHLGLQVIEIDVPGYAREGGTSNVSMDTVREFLRNILRYRTGRPWRAWKQRTFHAKRAPEPLRRPASSGATIPDNQEAGGSA
jgi:glycosyltransferase involved in cell wall biosynthesis